MALIPLYEAKNYLRVDSSDEDALVGVLLLWLQPVEGIGVFRVPKNGNA